MTRLRASLLLAITCCLAGCGDAGGDAAAATAVEDAGGSRRIARSVELEGQRLRVEIDRDTLLVGDAIRLLAIAEPSGDRLARFAEVGEMLGDFEATPLAAPRIAGAPPGTAVLQLELRTFDAGEISIPPLAAVFEPRGGGAAVSLASDAIPITVEGVLTAPFDPTGGDPGATEVRPSPELRPLKPAVALEAPREWIWWLASLAATVLLLAGVGVLLFLRRAPAASLPPGPWALAGLDRLAASVPPPGDAPGTRRFWESLSVVARGWLERRWDLPTRDRTTREIVAQLRSDGRLADEVVRPLERILRDADLAKFAGALPGPDAAAEALTLLRAIVARADAEASTDDATTAREAAA
ncbi:MAG: hypothetical protein FJ257_07200 [Phycisphaerae bacterium]|nr:hypothetical protein [Phycisphaerae bacterium]